MDEAQAPTIDLVGQASQTSATITATSSALEHDERLEEEDEE
jgi:hypothetical protein